MGEREEVGVWHGVLTACLVCAPLVAVYYFVGQVPQLAILTVVMNFGVGIAAGAACTWMMLRRDSGQRIGRLILGGVLSGAIVVTVQYGIVPPAWGFALFGPPWGAILGSIGVPVLFMLQGPKRRKQDPERRSRVSKVLRRAGSSEEDDGESRTP